MNIIPIRDVCFDDKAIRAMGAAFDQACNSLGNFAHDVVVRELIAKRIIGAATNGEVDPIRLQSQALVGFSIDGVSVPVASVGRTAPSPAYATVTHTA
jgi:hypothetical protein